MSVLSFVFDFVMVCGVQLYVWCWGWFDVLMLFMLYGWMDVVVLFQFVVDVFVGDWQVIVFDVCGFGLFDWLVVWQGGGYYWFYEYFGDFDVFVDCYVLIGEVNLVGYSMGVNVVCLYVGVWLECVCWVVDFEGFGFVLVCVEQVLCWLCGWLDELCELFVLWLYVFFDDVVVCLIKINLWFDLCCVVFFVVYWLKCGDDGFYYLLVDLVYKMLGLLLYWFDEVMVIWKQVCVKVLYIEVVNLLMFVYFVGDILLFEFKVCFDVFFDWCEKFVEDVGYMVYYDQFEQIVVLIEVFCVQVCGVVVGQVGGVIVVLQQNEVLFVMLIMNVDFYCYFNVFDGLLLFVDVVCCVYVGGVILWVLIDYDEIGGQVVVCSEVEVFGMCYLSGVEILVMWVLCIVYIVGLYIDFVYLVLVDGLYCMCYGCVVCVLVIVEQFVMFGIFGVYEGVLKYVLNFDLILCMYFVCFFVENGYVELMLDVFDCLFGDGKFGFVLYCWVFLFDVVGWICVVGGEVVVVYLGCYCYMLVEFDVFFGEFIDFGGCVIEVIMGSYMFDQYCEYVDVVCCFGFEVLCGLDFYVFGEGCIEFGSLLLLLFDLILVWECWF